MLLSLEEKILVSNISVYIIVILVQGQIKSSLK